MELVQPYVDKGWLLKRDASFFQNNLAEFTLIRVGDCLVGCAGLRFYQSEAMAEIYCFAVHANKHHLGYGERLLDELIVKAKKNNSKRLFALSKYGQAWFLKQGFELLDLSQLPQERQEKYNQQRQSSIFVKNI